MTTIKVNYNNKVTVRLTEYGEKQYTNFLNKLQSDLKKKGVNYKPGFPVNRQLTVSMWAFMSAFGSFMAQGSPDVIESEIQIHL